MSQPVAKSEDMVFPIADALMMRLGILQKRGAQAKIVHIGEQTKKYPVTADFSIVSKPEVKASFKGEKAASVLVRIRGDLWLYMIHWATHKELICVVLNANRMPFTPNKIKEIDGLHPKQVKPVIERAIIRSYRRKVDETTWRRDGGTKNAGGLDGRQEGSAGQGGRAANSG